MAFRCLRLSQNAKGMLHFHSNLAVQLLVHTLRHTTKNARRKLEIPMPAAMPWKTPVNCRGDTCRNIVKHKTKFAYIVDADESVRIRLEGVPYRYHEDHISAKGINSLSHYNLVHKFIPMPQALISKTHTCCQQ